MPGMREGAAEGILRGMYKLKAAAGEATVQLFGSGTILNEVLRAQEILATKYQVHADVWSVTSYTELRRDALAVGAGGQPRPGGEGIAPQLPPSRRDPHGSRLGR